MTTSHLHLGRPLRVGAVARLSWQHGVGLVAWALFGAGWGRVISQGVVSPVVRRDAVLTVGLLAVIALTTLGWVRWNVVLQRRKGPRQQAARGPGAPAFDRLGRRLVAVIDVREAGEVVVRFDDAVKRYGP